ncbi:hypothetical protein RRG08_030407 [Elysia crispata]|uniref:Uncharacterized protein n=1 Tax=Elysia crispata TaxID=231223 RepID=A0AAE0YFU4_9GAST|nr:hypothetical protein RRG08_030407 [Elysia crispata]
MGERPLGGQEKRSKPQTWVGDSLEARERLKTTNMGGRELGGQRKIALYVARGHHLKKQIGCCRRAAGGQTISSTARSSAGINELVRAQDPDYVFTLRGTIGQKIGEGQGKGNQSDTAGGIGIWICIPSIILTNLTQTFNYSQQSCTKQSTNENHIIKNNSSERNSKTSDTRFPRVNHHNLMYSNPSPEMGQAKDLWELALIQYLLPFGLACSRPLLIRVTKSQAPK